MKRIVFLSVIGLATLSGGAIQAAPKASQEGDVIVPVPIDRMGTLVVEGEKGASQSEGYEVTSCKLDASGLPKKFGCFVKKNGGKLNEPMMLQEGDYYVTYAKSKSALFRIKRGDTLRLQLRKISVPKVDGKFKFEVFIDLTDVSEQDRFMRQFWEDGNSQNYVKSYCPSDAKTKVCIAYNGSDFRGFRNTAIFFSEKGEFSFYYINQDTIASRGRVMITDPSDGEFVSVFPGVYGISFTTPAGEVIEQYGIRVE